MGDVVLPSWLFTAKKEKKNLILSHANMHTDLQWYVENKKTQTNKNPTTGLLQYLHFVVSKQSQAMTLWASWMRHETLMYHDLIMSVIF